MVCYVARFDVTLGTILCMCSLLGSVMVAITFLEIAVPSVNHVLSLYHVYMLL